MACQSLHLGLHSSQAAAHAGRAVLAVCLSNMLSALRFTLHSSSALSLPPYVRQLTSLALHLPPTLRSPRDSLRPSVVMTDVALVEETVKRLASHKGVVGIVIVNGDGVPIRTTLDPELAVTYAALVSQLALKARHMVRELAEDGTDDLQFLRVRSKKHEIMIAPAFDRVS